MKHPRFVLYKDIHKEWRWRFVSSNGNVLADSGEGYKRKVDAEAGWRICREFVIASWLREAKR